MGDRTTRGAYVKPDSALVRAADDLLSRHSAQPGGLCPSCGQLSPCPSARHAVEVRRAAGLPDAAVLPDPLSGPGAGIGGPDQGLRRPRRPGRLRRAQRPRRQLRAAAWAAVAWLAPAAVAWVAPAARAVRVVWAAPAGLAPAVWAAPAAPAAYRPPAARTQARSPPPPTAPPR